MKDGPNLILLSRYLQSRDALTEEFEKLRVEFPNLRVHGLDPAKLQTDFSISAQGVVIDVGQWTAKEEEIVNTLRSANYTGGVIVISHRDPKEVPVPSNRNFEKVIFLDKPYDDNELIQKTTKMLLAPIIAGRKFPRHNTDEGAELVIEGAQQLAIACRVKNMSKGGAYLETTRQLSVSIGDSVTLKISLGQVKKVYAMRARVAWINSVKPGIGIEFVVVLGA